jgi:hypothetical protein
VSVTKGSTLHILTSNTREFPSIKGIKRHGFRDYPIDTLAFHGHFLAGREILAI